jgi:hypothetical protein
VTIDGSAALFLVIWFSLWTVGGILAIRGLVWLAFGKVSIRVGSELLEVRRRSLGRGKTLRYDADMIRNLGLVHAPTGASLRPSQGQTFDFNPNSGPFIFRYGAETKRFGGDLSWAEARNLLPLIQEKLPATARGEGV